VLAEGVVEPGVVRVGDDRQHEQVAEGEAGEVLPFVPPALAPERDPRQQVAIPLGVRDRVKGVDVVQERLHARRLAVLVVAADRHDRRFALGQDHADEPPEGGDAVAAEGEFGQARGARGAGEERAGEGERPAGDRRPRGAPYAPGPDALVHDARRHRQ